MDPRINTGKEELQTIHHLAFDCYDRRKKCLQILKEIGSLHRQITALLPKAGPALSKQLNDIDRSLSLLEDPGPGSLYPGLNKLNNELGGIFNIINSTEMQPTTQTTKAGLNAGTDLELLLIIWKHLNEQDIKKLNTDLVNAKLPALSL
jgi:hypothetical protein